MLIFPYAPLVKNSKNNSSGFMLKINQEIWEIISAPTQSFGKKEIDSLSV